MKRFKRRSERDQAIIAGLAAGLSFEDLAAKYGYAVSTVRSYVSEMLVRFECRDRDELAAVVVGRGGFFAGGVR